MSAGPRKLWFSSASDQLGPNDLVLVGVDGREELSRPYEYELLFECGLEHGLEEAQLNAALTARCSIDLSPDQTAPIHGVLRSLTLLPYEPGWPPRYRGVLVPRLWRLDLSRASRVFQDATVPAVVLAVLRLNGLQPVDDFDVAFGGASFPKLPYCVQYEESDLSFVSRLLEEHGLFYLFDQTRGAERVVLADRNAALPELPRLLSFASHDAESEHDDALREVRITRRVGPREVRIRAYRTDAQAPPSARAQVDEAVGCGVMRYYGEGVEDEDAIKTRAKLRAEALRVRGRTMEATTSALGLHAGSRFTLADHPLPEPNGDYYVLSMHTTVSVPGRLESGGGAHLRQAFEAVPFAVPFRPEARTPQPKVEGIVHAVIDGATPGVAAPIDEQGAYRVLLPFDAVATPGGRATCAIKRAQPSAGKDSGMHFPLHIGTEVVISHVDGDPDRPVIIGAVPNVANRSPVTAADATKSRISTRAGVLIEIDDAAG